MLVCLADGTVDSGDVGGGSVGVLARGAFGPTRVASDRWRVDVLLGGHGGAAGAEAAGGVEVGVAQVPGAKVLW